LASARQRRLPIREGLERGALLRNHRPLTFIRRFALPSPACGRCHQRHCEAPEGRRSNPRVARVAGLLRRFAPRNDVRIPFSCEREMPSASLRGARRATKQSTSRLRFLDCFVALVLAMTFEPFSCERGMPSASLRGARRATKQSTSRSGSWIASSLWFSQ
jgi:hypothetical protein